MELGGSQCLSQRGKTKTYMQNQKHSRMLFKMASHRETGYLIWSTHLKYAQLLDLSFKFNYFKCFNLMTLKRYRLLARHSFKSLTLTTLHQRGQLRRRARLFMTTGCMGLLSQRDDRRFSSLTREPGSIHALPVRQRWRPPSGASAICRRMLTKLLLNL